MELKEELSFLSNIQTVQEILDNMEFINCYIDEIEKLYEEKYKRIWYKHLGIMAYSCIEALLKVIIEEISRKCYLICREMQCDYYKDINAIWKMGLLEMIDHINATRLLYIAPKDRVEAFVMKEQRNRVHLYRSKSEPPAIYNKHYADSIVNMFYVIVNQLNTTEWYFGCAEACLKNIDEDGYNETKKVNYLQDELYEAIHSSQYLRKLFDGEKVSFEEQNQLKCALKNNQIKNYASAVALVLVGAQFGHYEDEWYTTKVDDFYNRIKENSGCSNAKIKELKREVERYYNSIVTTI